MRRSPGEPADVSTSSLEPFAFPRRRRWRTREELRRLAYDQYATISAQVRRAVSEVVDRAPAVVHVLMSVPTPVDHAESDVGVEG